MVINEATYVDQAEKVIKELLENKDKWGNPKPIKITTTKIRGLLAMSADIYNEIMYMEEKLPGEMCSKIDYLRVRFVYESGREPNTVKPFVERARLIEALKEVGGSRIRFIQFNRYLEALVAFHKYYVGDDM